MKRPRAQSAAVLALWLAGNGCTTLREIPRSDYGQVQERHGVRVETRDGLVYDFDYASFTADSLTYSPDPPAYYGMITFPEGGRFMADFTDSDKEQVKVGAKMRMTFRIRDNDTMRGGFKRYFWKAAPV